MRSKQKSVIITRILAILLAAYALLSLAACSSSEKEAEPVVSVQVTPVKLTSIEQTITAEAVLFPSKQAAITPKISSPVKKFLVNRGSRVKKGELLAVLENRDLEAAAVENQGGLEQAQAAYTTTTGASLPEEVQKAELEVTDSKQALDAEQKLYESRQNLYKQGALPRKDLDQAAVSYTQAKTAYDIAQKHLASMQSVGKEQTVKSALGNLNAAKGKYLGAKAQLSYTEIRSPIDGVVTDRPYYEGEMAVAGTPLITIMDTATVVARAHIPQEQAALLRIGDSAIISAPGLSDGANGKVTLISPATDPNSTTIEVWVQAPNPKGELRPGTSVQVAIVARKVNDAIVVPTSSLLVDNGKTSVMVIGKDDRAHQQQVEVGIRNQNEAQIVSGLKQGDTVVSTGGYGLPDNTKVKVEKPDAEPENASSAEGGAE